MAKKILVVVDMQNDFLTGPLGNAECAAVVEPVVQYIQQAKAGGAEVVLTRDTHTDTYLHTHEGQYLPVEHCIKGSDGWQVCPAVAQQTQGCQVFDKGQFGSPELAHYLQAQQADIVDFVGVCTDICVISNAMLARSVLPQASIRVYAPGCAGVTPQSHANALAAMRMCHIDILEE